MAERSWSSPNRALVWGLCVLAGLMVGVSGFSAESNHPTYLPPGLRYVDPTFLVHDWWVNSARHYHVAFFALVAVLAKAGVLELALAVLNILAVAAAMYGCFQIIRQVRSEYPTVALSLIIALVIATVGFTTVGSAFLFSSSLQPSTIATAATILAFAAFLEGRLKGCGLWLALAGAFHANFLAVNFAAFGLSYAITMAQSRPWRELLSRDLTVGLLRLLSPSLVVAAISAPMILSFQVESLSPEMVSQADWIFFHFAVPFHYTPMSFLDRFPSFLALQILGFAWTSRAIPDVQTRLMAWGLQIALAVLIWSATVLTTLVFVPQVSRLFFWRLAPFALLLAALLTLVGMLRVIARSRRDDAGACGDALRLGVTFCALPFLATGGAELIGQYLSTAPVQPSLLAYATVFLLAVTQYWAKETPVVGRGTPGLVAGMLVAFSLLAQPFPVFRYSLLAQPAWQDAEDELYRHVAASTSRDAQFLVPPALARFRLQAARAIVVDIKALPMDRPSTIEWYRRLEAISGTRNPKSMAEVAAGYERLDEARLEHLRCRYGVTHAVIEQRPSFNPDGWQESYRNRHFRVLQPTSGEPCLDGGAILSGQHGTYPRQAGDAPVSARARG